MKSLVVLKKPTPSPPRKAAIVKLKAKAKVSPAALEAQTNAITSVFDFPGMTLKSPAMHYSFLFIFGFFGVALSALSAQAYDLDRIALESTQISDLGGLQSYAYGIHEGQWLIVGGRLDGLHRRQPFAAFDQAGHNNRLVVVDPQSQENWSVELSSLSTDLSEQLSATNFLFHQDGDLLYVVGGYGFSPSAGDHTTFPFLTIIDLPELIEAIKNDEAISPYFQQVTDESLRITGGRMGKLGEVFYLVGGQKFIGRYNPMGPDHGPGFIQEYTNQVRRFTLSEESGEITLQSLESWTDEEQLHRRDYNLFPQIFPDGSEGYTAFSGVFRYDADLPFLNSVDIDADGYSVNYDFLQYYNHYHCPGIPIYSAESNEMQTLFFGGIAQFFVENGERVRDDEVPFVKTITRVKRTSTGEMEELVLPLELPAYLGAGAEFILAPDLPTYDNGVIRLDELPIADSLLIGYIYGGIQSEAANIFFVNDGSQSLATSGIFAVYLLGETANSVEEGPTKENIHLQLFPNPVKRSFTLDFELPHSFAALDLTVVDGAGREVFSTRLTNLAAGKQQYTWDAAAGLSAGSYVLSLNSDGRLLGLMRFIYGQ